MYLLVTLSNGILVQDAQCSKNGKKIVQKYELWNNFVPQRQKSTFPDIYFQNKVNLPLCSTSPICTFWDFWAL